MSQPHDYTLELTLFRATLASGEDPIVLTTLDLNTHQPIVTSAKPQQARHLGKFLCIVATGKVPSSSGETVRDAIGWEPTGSFGRKFDGYRGVIEFSLSSGPGEKVVKIFTANGTRDEFLEELVDTKNIATEFFAMGLKVLGELVMFNLSGNEMGCVGFEKGRSIIRYARKFINGLSPVKFGIRVFDLNQLGTLPGSNISDGQLKEKFMSRVFKDSTCIEVIETTAFKVGKFNDAVYIDGKTVVDQYNKFPEYLMKEAENRGFEGWVVTFPPSWLHFDNAPSPTTKDYKNVPRSKSACKAKAGFNLNLYAGKNANGTVSLYEHVLGPAVCTLNEPYMCLLKFPTPDYKALVNVRCTWIHVEYEKNRPLINLPWEGVVKKVQLVGVHQITDDDICPPRSIPSDIVIVAEQSKFWKSIADATHKAMQDAREMGMYNAEGKPITAIPDSEKFTRIREKFGATWTQYPYLSSFKPGPTTFKFGPGSEGVGAAGGSSAASSSCQFSCRCSQVERKPEDTFKMFAGKSFYVWPAGYKPNDPAFAHAEATIGHGGGSLIDPLKDKSCDFVVVPFEQIATNKSFVGWYASLEGKKPTVILSYWLCHCFFLNAFDPSIDRAKVVVPAVHTNEDFYEFGKDLSLYGKKPVTPPPTCNCPPDRHKRVTYNRPSDDPTRCKKCLLLKVDPKEKKAKVFTGFDHQVIHIWGGDETIEAKVTENKGVIYTEDTNRCDHVYVKDPQLAVCPEMLKWLARFAVLPLIYKIEGIHDCITKQLSKPDASFELASRV